MLQENAIQKLEGLETLVNLDLLNVSSNYISKIEGLQNCHKLKSLLISGNKIGGANGDQSCIDSLKGLLDVPSLEMLDIQKNNLADGAVIEEVFAKMPNLRVLYLKGNELTRKVSSYRKTMIAAMPNLEYLDDRPVTDDERRRADAFKAGHAFAEKEEMEKIKEERNHKWKAHKQEFMSLINKAKEDQMAAKALKNAQEALPVKQQIAIARTEKEQAQKDLGKNESVYQMKGLGEWKPANKAQLKIEEVDKKVEELRQLDRQQKMEYFMNSQYGVDPMDVLGLEQQSFQDNFQQQKEEMVTQEAQEV